MNWQFARYNFLIACFLLTLLSVFWLPQTWAWISVSIFGLLTLLGLYDVKQPHHAILRNYPILGHLRFLFESIRTELRQYLFEGENDALPFSRAQRTLVYARAKNETSERPFGTLLDVYQVGYEFFSHSIQPHPLGNIADFRISIGGNQCRQPYSASIFNISAMSFGSLSANAILALNKGAQLGGFYHDTGEGSISEYHLKHGGDIVWEIGSGYFGCRDKQGSFDAAAFAQKAILPAIKMIEIKLSQGAKPGHGGILPKAKITPEIALTRDITMDADCISPAHHTTFSTPFELINFIQKLRDLSQGKPVGFKLCVGHPWEFMGIVKAMLETGIYPDFIVVDGKEGGTGTAPEEFANHLGLPLREGFMFVHNTLVGAGLRQHIKLGASGKIISAFDIARMLAIGADWVNAARGFMFALGCLQSLTCNTNQCPTGVATQDPHRQKALVVNDKASRVYNFHRNTLLELAEILAASGLSQPNQIEPHHLVRRISDSEIRLFSQIHAFLDEGELLTDDKVGHHFYRASWALAQSGSFAPKADAANFAQFKNAHLN